LPTHTQETEEYYKLALDPIFSLINTKAYITIARWSYIPEANNPLLFYPEGVGGMREEQVKCLRQAFNEEKFKRALKEFSFTKLLAENDREIWFHFTPEDPEGDPESIDRQVYLRDEVEVGGKKIQILEVSAERASDPLVLQLLQEFKRAAEPLPSLYEGGPLLEKKEAIKATLHAAIFSLFKSTGCGIKHIYFMPLMAPAGAKKVVGIISINTSSRIELRQLIFNLQPHAQGILARFHLEELDEQRKKFSLHSAIAAIMSRNMSHNLGSHVLWHLSQELKSE
jgi:hypothetical protein